jgi:pyroglutamyl-peptidase
VRILVTGFGPFPGVEHNVSAVTARAIDGEVVRGVELVGRVVDVSWRRAWPTIAQLVDDVKPAALVMLGVATMRETVQIERVAFNEADPARPDCDGAHCEGPQLVEGGPDRLPTGLPWAELCTDGVEPSDDAGRYLCNGVFYRAAHALTIPVGFVHVPAQPETAALPLLRRYAALLAA